MAEARETDEPISRRTSFGKSWIAAVGAVGFALGIGGAKLDERKKESDREEARRVAQQEALEKARFSFENFLGQKAWVAVVKDKLLIVPSSVNIRSLDRSGDREWAGEHPEYELNNPLIIIRLNVGGYVGMENMKPLVEDKPNGPFTGNAWVLVPGHGFANLWAIMRENEEMRRYIQYKGFDFKEGVVYKTGPESYSLKTADGDLIPIG